MTNIIVKFVNKRNTKRMCEMFSKMFSNCLKYFIAKKKKKKKSLTSSFPDLLIYCCLIYGGYIYYSNFL